VKPLTRRQHEFLENLLNLFQEEQEPVHYSRVAKRVGVGSIAAYEMLCLLERRGYAHSEFTIKRGSRGPGRPRLVFRPSLKAVKTLSRLADGLWEDDDWEDTKGRILDRLQETKEKDYHQVIEELLLMLPDEESPSSFVANMTALIALGMRSMKDLVGETRLPKALRMENLSEALDMSSLMGLSFGISKISGGPEAAERLLSIAKRYQDIIESLGVRHRKLMSKFRRDLFEIMGM
jgi:predicted ArsR family transcriptional regulator